MRIDLMNMLMRPTTTTTYQSQHKVSALRCRDKNQVTISGNAHAHNARDCSLRSYTDVADATVLSIMASNIVHRRHFDEAGPRVT